MEPIYFRDGQMDVAIVAGPRVRAWPTLGVRALTRWCGDAGLKVGWYGGEDLKVRGVLPAAGSGGVVLMEDSRRRVHRIQAKAIVKVSAPLHFPNPFPGWYSPGLVPESTARKLMDQGSLSWQPMVAILGTGNRALRLGSELILSRRAARVVCIESVFTRVQGWEVERRRFEGLGGKFVFGKPVNLVTRSPFSWQFKVQDEHGNRVLDVARVISVGPFDQDPGFKEHPAGSFLYEWENSDQLTFLNDVESIMLDENRAVLLASKIIRGIGNLSGELKSQLEKATWVSKLKLRELESMESKRFQFQYEGKWLSNESKKVLQEFAGTPKNLQPGKWLASIECVEAIGCRACERSCPAHAIKIERTPDGGTSSFLVESDCTGCGQCLIACPSQVPVMMDGDQTQSFTHVILPYRDKTPLKKGDRVSLLNRRGEVLAQSKVVDLFLEGDVAQGGVPLWKVEVPIHLAWEVRGMLNLIPAGQVDHHDDLYQERGVRTEVQLQGESRRVREGQLVSVSLFEVGAARPNDILVCEDGSCGLCQVEVDGQKKFACETKIHQGMSIRFTRDHQPSGDLCPCEDISAEGVQEKITAMKPETLEALSPLTAATQGRCHGLLCRETCSRLARQCGVKADGREVHWGFPWTDWVMRG
jgi:ferredoxin